MVFLDIDDIPPGSDFVEVIESALSEADVLLALIGPRWITAENSHGRRRLEDPMDYVRLEVGTALRRDIRVIPILVGGSDMPTQDQLPPDLEGLVRRNAFEISDSRFHADVVRLIAVLAKASTTK